MKIYVEGKEIETKDIVQITDSEDKHGFIIHLVKEGKIHITESRKYDNTPGENSRRNDVFDRLKKKVITEWEKDKTEFIILNL